MNIFEPIVYVIIGIVMGVMTIGIMQTTKIPNVLPRCQFLETQDGDWFATGFPCVYRPDINY